MFVTYGFDSSLKGIPSIFINILHDGFPGVKAHHLENFPLILRIVSVHPAADLHILPDQILVYICSSIENRQHQPHTKQQLYVWPEWKPDILYIYIYIYLTIGTCNFHRVCSIFSIRRRKLAYQISILQQDNSNRVMNEYIIQYVSHCWSSSVEGLSIARKDAYLFIHIKTFMLLYISYI